MLTESDPVLAGSLQPSGMDERARSEGELKMGYWNDSSSWSSAPGWKSGGVKQVYLGLAGGATPLLFLSHICHSASA